MTNSADRQISILVKSLALFGRPGPQLGWCFVAVGMLGSGLVIREVLSSGSWNGVASLIFPLFGLGLLVFDQQQSGDLLSLLRAGKEVPGSFVSRARQRQGSSSNGTSTRSYIVRYSYETEPGQKSYAQASTTRNDTLEVATVLYDPNTPERSLVLEYQPGGLRLEGARVVEASLSSYAVLLAPMAGLAATIAAPLIVLLG